MAGWETSCLPGPKTALQLRNLGLMAIMRPPSGGVEVHRLTRANFPTVSVPQKPSRQSRSFVSTIIVTGPSLIREIFMSAPNFPVCTRRPSAVWSCRMNSS